MSGPRRFLSGSDGTTAIEFAFAAVALVAVVFGTMEMGRMIWTQQVLQSAAAETARCLAIGSANCPSAPSFAVKSAAARGVGDLDATGVLVSANDSCGSTAGTFTKVTITYSFAPVLPAYIPAPGGGLSATACYPHL